MKKTVAVLVAVLVLVAMSLSVSAYYVDTLLPFLFKTAGGTPTVDGVKDEAYEASDMIEVMQPGLVDPILDNRATAKVWTLWDDTNIYIYAEVNDFTPSSTYTEGLDPWMFDSFEVYLDFANTKATNAYMHEQELTGQFRFCRNTDVTEVSGIGMYSDEIRDKVQFKVIDNGEEGYIVEVAIPHRDISSKIGFSVQINDDVDNDNVRDTCVYTKMDAYMACQMNYVFDTLELEGCTATNGYEDDYIMYNTIDDLHELNYPTVEEPAESTEAPVESTETTSDSGDNDASYPWDKTEPEEDASPIVWIAVGIGAAAVIIAAVVVIEIVKYKKK